MIRHYGVPTPAALSVVDEEFTSRSNGGTESDAPTVPTGAGNQTAAVPGAPFLTPAGPHGVTEDIRTGFWHVRPTYTSSFEAYVPIQNGCDKFCTFCAVPYTRGREVSRPSGEIINEVVRLVEAGYRSITLLGQNVNSYGLDRRSDEIGFSRLLHEIGKQTAGYPVWIYFPSPHPRDMTTDVLEAVAMHDTLANQIHLPIQSGDDKVLIRMNRNYRLSGYREVVNKIREILPEATLFTDIIVGFSGETEAQFQKTRAAMEEFRYDMAFIAMYSPRPGAASARWADNIDQDEKKRRLRELTAVLQTTAGERNASQIGRTVAVLVEGRDRQGFLSGRTEGRIPVRIEDPADGTEIPPGSFLDVEITAARPLSLYGVPTGDPLLPVSAAAPDQRTVSVVR
jgi:tRNA-2-methylthio-N6-dimethylallyladenosine synthase